MARKSLGSSEINDLLVGDKARIYYFSTLPLRD